MVRAEGSRRGQTASFLQQIKNRGYKPNIILTCESPDAIKSAVSKKLGIGLLYYDVVRKGLDDGRFKQLRIPELTMERQFHVIYHKTRPLSFHAQTFLRMLCDWREKKVETGSNRKRKEESSVPISIHVAGSNGLSL